MTDDEQECWHRATVEPIPPSGHGGDDVQRQIGRCWMAAGAKPLPLTPPPVANWRRCLVCGGWWWPSSVGGDALGTSGLHDTSQEIRCGGDGAATDSVD